MMSEENILREIADLLSKRKSRSEMIGEFLREASLLVLVFAPLDTMFNPDASPRWVIAAVMGVAATIGYLGIRIEESRR